MSNLKTDPIYLQILPFFLSLRVFSIQIRLLGKIFYCYKLHSKLLVIKTVYPCFTCFIFCSYISKEIKNKHFPIMYNMYMYLYLSIFIYMYMMIVNLSQLGIELIDEGMSKMFLLIQPTDIDLINKEQSELTQICCY